MDDQFSALFVLPTLPCHWVSSPKLEIYEIIYSPMTFVHFQNKNEAIFNEIRKISVLQLIVYSPKTLDSRSYIAIMSLQKA